MITRRHFAAASLASSFQQPFRLGIAGLVHGHARGFLRAMKERPEVGLAGVSEADEALLRAYSIPPQLSYRDLPAMLDRARPDAVAIFSNTFDHMALVKECAARRIPVMMEKPLAVSMEHARAIAAVTVPVVVNYETTWYRSHAEVRRLITAESIRKMVAMDGHQGPKEIGVGSEFLAWLTDPVKNGAGALFDFGCYGANLMTWMMDDARPLAVTARLQTFKPHIYGRVDDEATIIVEYPKAQGIIQASWNWPVGRKDFEVYGETAYAHAIGGSVVRSRRAGAKAEETLTPPELPAGERDSISYLKAVVQEGKRPAGLSSLANNLIATEILCAARESARTGRTIELAR